MVPFAYYEFTTRALVVESSCFCRGIWWIAHAIGLYSDRDLSIRFFEADRVSNYRWADVSGVLIVSLHGA